MQSTLQDVFLCLFDCCDLFFDSIVALWYQETILNNSCVIFILENVTLYHEHFARATPADANALDENDYKNNPDFKMVWNH